MRIFLLACLLGPFAASADPKILLIGQQPDHGYRTHTYMDDCELLAKCLRQTPGLTTAVSRGWPTDPEAFKDVSCIVVHTKLGGNLVFAEAHREQAIKLFTAGVGLVAIHWGTGADLPTESALWQKTLGGLFNAQKGGFSRYKVEQTMMRVADATHPISRGWKDFRCRDEYYYDLRFEPGAIPVALAKVGSQDYPIAWAFARADGGRSFGHVGAHFHDNFADEAFRRLLVNGILWAAKKEIPAVGGPVAILPTDLDLSPEFAALKPGAPVPPAVTLHRQRLAQIKALNEQVTHQREHGSLPATLAQARATLQAADWVKPSSLFTGELAVYGETQEGLSFRVGPALAPR